MTNPEPADLPDDVAEADDVTPDDQAAAEEFPISELQDDEGADASVGDAGDTPAEDDANEGAGGEA